MREITFPGKVVAVSGALETAKIPYAIGGAIALGFYALPRATSDIDINVFVGTEDFDRVAFVLGDIGIDVGVDRAALERAGQCRLLWGRTPVDLFMANVDFHSVMARAVRRKPFGEATINILAPEHLIICKAIFNRVKDWPDIEQIVFTMPDLNHIEVADWLTRMLGAEDARTLRFLALTRT